MHSLLGQLFVIYLYRFSVLFINISLVDFVVVLSLFVVKSTICIHILWFISLLLSFSYSIPFLLFVWGTGRFVICIKMSVHGIDSRGNWVRFVGGVFFFYLHAIRLCVAVYLSDLRFMLLLPLPFSVQRKKKNKKQLPNCDTFFGNTMNNYHAIILYH